MLYPSQRERDGKSQNDRVFLDGNVSYYSDALVTACDTLMLRVAKAFLQGAANRWWEENYVSSHLPCPLPFSAGVGEGSLSVEGFNL
jgi:hypothetical protein